MDRKQSYNEQKIEEAVNSLISTRELVEGELHPDKYRTVKEVLDNTIQSLNNADDILVVKQQVREEIIQPVEHQLKAASVQNKFFGYMGVISFVAFFISFLFPKAVTIQTEQFNRLINAQPALTTKKELVSAVEKKPTATHIKKESKSEQKKTVKTSETFKQESQNVNPLTAVPKSSDYISSLLNSQTTLPYANLQTIKPMKFVNIVISKKLCDKTEQIKNFFMRRDYDAFIEVFCSNKMPEDPHVMKPSEITPFLQGVELDKLVKGVFDTYVGTELLSGYPWSHTLNDYIDDNLIRFVSCPVVIIPDKYVTKIAP